MWGSEMEQDMVPHRSCAIAVRFVSCDVGFFCEGSARVPIAFLADSTGPGERFARIEEFRRRVAARSAS